MTISNEGYLAEVKVIRETKPLLNARIQLRNASWELQSLEFGYKYENGMRVKVENTPSARKRAEAKLAKAKEKYNKIFNAQVVKSTKTKLVAGGWCSE